MSHVEQLLCPNCGHHVGDMTRPDTSRQKTSATSVSAEIRRFAELHLPKREDGMRRPVSEVWDTFEACPLTTEPVSKKALTLALRALGYETYRSKSERGYVGVDLRTDHSFHGFSS